MAARSVVVNSYIPMGRNQTSPKREIMVDTANGDSGSGTVLRKSRKSDSKMTAPSMSRLPKIGLVVVVLVVP